MKKKKMRLIIKHLREARLVQIEYNSHTLSRITAIEKCLTGMWIDGVHYLPDENITWSPAFPDRYIFMKGKWMKAIEPEGK
jgi:hypothetical protein